MFTTLSKLISLILEKFSLIALVDVSLTFSDLLRGFTSYTSIPLLMRVIISLYVNGDGVIDISDSIGILGHYLNGENSSKALTGAYFVAGDMVEDSEIDISDAISALQYYLKN